MSMYSHFLILPANLLGTGGSPSPMEILVLAWVPPPPRNGNRLQKAAAAAAVHTEGSLCELAVLKESACGGTTPSTMGTLPSEAGGGIVPSSAGRANGRPIITRLLPSSRNPIAPLYTTLSILATRVAATGTVFSVTGAACTAML